jgi:hypothetical protein
LPDLQGDGLCGKEACLLTSLFVSFVAKTKEIGLSGYERYQATQPETAILRISELLSSYNSAREKTIIYNLLTLQKG